MLRIIRWAHAIALTTLLTAPRAATAQTPTGPVVRIGDAEAPLPEVPPAARRFVPATIRPIEADPLYFPSIEPAPDRVPLSVRVERGGVDAIGVPRQYVRAVVDLDSTDAYVSVCSAPCTLWVRPGPVEFTVGGRSFRAQHFRVLVPPTGGSIVASRSRVADYRLGVALFPAGAALTSVFVFTALVFMGQGHYCYPYGCGPPVDYPTAWVLAGLSTGAMLTGIFMLANNGRPTIRRDAGGARPRSNEWALGAAPTVGGGAVALMGAF